MDDWCARHLLRKMHVQKPFFTMLLAVRMVPALQEIECELRLRRPLQWQGLFHGQSINHLFDMADADIKQLSEDGWYGILNA